MDRLSDWPDWGYLLREFYELYRFLPSGGSAPIRGHQRRVREAIGRLEKINPEMRFPGPAEKPAIRHLRRALDEGRAERHSHVIRAIEAIAGELSWQYGYDRMPRGLAEKYAYAEFAGPVGPIVSSEVILGIVLFAPKCTYPAHAHDGITESYVCLSGAASENNQGVYAPGSLIFNPPGTRHRITVSDREPCLLAYAWEGPQEKLAGQIMNFRKKQGG